MSTKPELRELIRSSEFIVAPGVFDMISARVADRVGFEEVWTFETRLGAVVSAGRWQAAGRGMRHRGRP